MRLDKYEEGDYILATFNFYEGCDVLGLYLALQEFDASSVAKKTNAQFRHSKDWDDFLVKLQDMGLIKQLIIKDMAFP